jgi:hypothetical protein
MPVKILECGNSLPLFSAAACRSVLISVTVDRQDRK